LFILLLNLAALARLPLRVERSGTELGSPRAFEAALRWGISAYDAAYLVLAQDLDATLMTRDRRLNAAAEKSGIRWVCADQAGRSRLPAAAEWW